MPQVNSFKEFLTGLLYVIDEAYGTDRLKPVVSSKFMKEVKQKFPEIIPYIDVITTKKEKKSILNILPYVLPKIEYECHLNPYDYRFLVFVTENAAVTTEDFKELVGLFSDIVNRQVDVPPYKQKLGRIAEIMGQSLMNTVKEDGTKYDTDDYLLMLKSLRYEIFDKILYMYIDFDSPICKQKLNTTDLLNAKNLITELAFGLFDGDQDYVDCVFYNDPPGCDNPEDDEVKETTKDSNQFLESVTDFISRLGQSKLIGSFSVSKETGKINADVELTLQTHDSVFEYRISLETNLTKRVDIRICKKLKETTDKSDVIGFVKDCAWIITKITKEK